MIVNEYNIVEYITKYPDEYTCLVDGKEQPLIVVDGALQLKDCDGYFSGFATRVTYTATTYPSKDYEVVLPEHVINAIKSLQLSQCIDIDLEALLPAAKEMISHYSSTESRINGELPLPYIRMYVLKNIDFAQPSKGHVIISPNTDGVANADDFIKGYVYHCGDFSSIKFETVQGWRYKQVLPSDLIDMGYPEWVPLTVPTF